MAARLGQRLLTHEFKEGLERHRAMMQPLDRQMFEGRAIHFDNQFLTDCIDLKNHEASP